MVYKSSVYVCMCVLDPAPEAYPLHLCYFLFFCFFELLWESAGCVEGGGKLVHKASATQHRDMHQFPLHPLQLHRSHNLACPLRLMIAEPVSPFSSSRSLPPSSILAPTVFSTPLYHCWAHIPHSLFCELCFPFLLTWVCFPSYWPSFFLCFSTLRKVLRSFDSRRDWECKRDYSLQPPPTHPHNDNSPPVFLLSSFPPTYPSLCLSVPGSAPGCSVWASAPAAHYPK